MAKLNGERIRKPQAQRWINEGFDRTDPQFLDKLGIIYKMETPTSERPPLSPHEELRARLRNPKERF